MPERSSSKRPTGAGKAAGPTDPEAASPEPGGFALQDPAMCQVAFCPVSMLLTATGAARPEVVEHLLAAGRELLLAAQAVINTRAEGFARSSPLEHIDIG